ncbi:probable cytochrome P450 313a4 [Condylostylus longicornis]|uniref:probable cytochrome P450 313a4 n=1 Tax=Condylostylus longicornis TaxID=2530218 RepID=UPI00244DC997|nr:probable cytochrome P450 313a4 [Condylostylus longicornis]
MFIALVLFLAILVIAWLHWVWDRRRFYKAKKEVGGPFEFPIIGSGLNFIDQSKPLYFLNGLHKIYGHTYFGFLGLKPCFITCDPKIIEEVFTNENLVNKMDIYNVINDFAYNGLFTSERKKWQHSRKHINKAFTNKVLLSFYNIFNKQALELCNILEQHVGKGEIDLYTYIERVQLDTACLTTMGQETNFIRGENNELLEAYTDLIRFLGRRIFNPLLTNNFIFSYFYGKKRQYDKSLNIIKSNTLGFIEKKYLEIKKAQEDGSNKDQDSSPEDEMNITKSKSIFIDIMVREYMAGNFTWKELQAEADTMIIAAYETTTNVLYITLYLLSIYPEYQDKLYEEIISVTTAEDISITPEHVRLLTYMDMIMNETMRLISPVPIVGRDATENVKLGKYNVPKGTNIIIDVFSLHHCEEIWGPNANHVFNPDNFLKENLVNKHPYSFVPFTKGIRNCIGWRYATISYKIMLSIILKKYKVSSTFKFKDLRYTEQIVLKFEENPKISFELRKNKTIS